MGPGGIYFRRYYCVRQILQVSCKIAAPSHLWILPLQVFVFSQILYHASNLFFPSVYKPLGRQGLGIFTLRQYPFQKGKILGRGKRYPGNVFFFTIGDFLIFYPDKGLYVRAGGTIKLYFVPIYLRADKHSQLAAGTLLGKVIVGRKFKAVFRKL